MPQLEVSFNADVILRILEVFIAENGSYKNLHILLVSKQAYKRLLPAFYRHLVVFDAHAVKALNRIFLAYPSRIRYVDSFFIRIGDHPYGTPSIFDKSYPKNYRARYRAFRPDALARKNTRIICSLLEHIAYQLKELNIVTRDRCLALETTFKSLHFPVLRELRVPVELVNSGDAEERGLIGTRFPSVTALGVYYDMHRTGADALLFHQNYDHFSSLTHLYISFGYRSERDIHRALKSIRAAPRVSYIALDCSGGSRLPFRAGRLDKYEVHPKVVFVAQPDYLGLREFEDLPKDGVIYGEILDTTLFLDRDRVRNESMWLQVEEKVHMRWQTFEEHVEPEDKAYIRPSEQLFIRCA